MCRDKLLLLLLSSNKYIVFVVYVLFFVSAGFVIFKFLFVFCFGQHSTSGKFIVIVL